MLRLPSSLGYSIVHQARDIANVSEAISKPYRRASEAGRLLRHFVPRNVRNMRDRIHARGVTWKFRYVSLPKLELFGAVKGSVGDLRRATF
jgi:hypothetical protein